jgi:hypothetical protein
MMLAEALAHRITGRRIRPWTATAIWLRAAFE